MNRKLKIITPNKTLPPPPPPLARPAPQEQVTPNTDKSNSKHSFAVGDSICQFYTENEKFYLIINNRPQCEEFSIMLENSLPLFNQHCIINNITILQQVLFDGFNHTSSVNLLFSRDGNKYIITIGVTTAYINDELILEIPLVEKTVTSSQLIGHIDYKMGQYHNKQTAINLSVKILEAELSALKAEFSEYIKSHEIMTGIKRTYNLFGQLCTKVINVRTSDTQINLSHRAYSYYLNDKYKVYEFNLNNFRYLTNLNTITLSDCPFTDLKFITISPYLQRITIRNMPDLQRIGHLASFKNLESVTIEGQCNIIDLGTVMKCPKLKLLRVPYGTSIRMFPPSVTFRLIIGENNYPARAVEGTQVPL